MHGWTEYPVSYGHKNDPALLTNGVFAEMPFLHVTKEVFTRDGADAVLRALHAVGAVEVPTESFRAQCVVIDGTSVA